MDARRQGSIPHAKTPSMATHGGSVNVRGSHAQVDHGGLGLQRQQQMAAGRSPLTRADTPVVLNHGGGGRQENRILPIGGPVVSGSHRSSVDATAAMAQKPASANYNPKSSLRRQAEFDDGDPRALDPQLPQYHHDHSGHRNSDASASQSQHGSERSGHHPRSQHSSRHSAQSGHQSSLKSQLSEKHKERERQHLEDEMLQRARDKQIQEIRREIRKEKRTMLAFSSTSLFLGILWLIAVCLSYWYFVYADENSLAIAMRRIKPTDNSTEPRATHPADTVNDLFVSSHVGLWRVCRTKRYVSSGNERIQCFWHKMFPTEEQLRTYIFTDKFIVDYQRTEACFAIISLLVMIMVVPVALYTLKNTRYMFKRLVAGLYFFSSVTVLVVLEVTQAKIEHEKSKSYLRPPKSTVSYGFCFYVGWVVLSFNLLTACVYIAYSRKRKGDKALDDGDDEIIGR